MENILTKDTMKSGSGDRIKPAANITTDDGKPVKENDNNLYMREECGDIICEQVSLENISHSKHENNISPLNENCVADLNESQLPTDSNIDVIDKAPETNENCNLEPLPDITDRITECKNIIASLKQELKDERNKLDLEFQSQEAVPENLTPCEETNSACYLTDLSYPTNFFTASVDTKLYSDRNLLEYEKQLQRYQRTLNMAQNAKKNAIRKQMLAKAFKLKLLELENQCNIELLRVKQNLQCLEPLKMIADTWKTEKDDYDLSKYDLIPLFPEIYANSISNTHSVDNSDLEINQEELNSQSKIE